MKRPSQACGKCGAWVHAWFPEYTDDPDTLVAVCIEGHESILPDRTLDE